MGKYKLLKLSSKSRRQDYDDDDDEDDNKPVTKRYFKKFESRMIWPPVFTRDADMTKAHELHEERQYILRNDSLSVEEKLALLESKDRDFFIFKQKAVSKVPTNTISHLSSGANQQFAGPGASMRIDDIVAGLTKTQQTHGRDLLTGLQRVGNLNWTDKGELYDSNTNSVVPGSDIQTLVWYNSLRNKKNTPIPAGFEEFNEAVKKVGYTKRAAEREEPHQPPPSPSPPPPPPPAPTVPFRTPSVETPSSSRGKRARAARKKAAKSERRKARRFQSGDIAEDADSIFQSLFDD